MKAMWFSRHQPTETQLMEIKRMGYDINDNIIDTGMQLGAMPLNSESDVQNVVSKLKTHSPDAIFGVFATPMAAWMFKNGIKIPCYASWNINRSPEGGRPTFSHKSWEQVGYI